jgi:hypothetical protein
MEYRTYGSAFGSISIVSPGNCVSASTDTSWLDKLDFKTKNCKQFTVIKRTPDAHITYHQKKNLQGSRDYLVNCSSRELSPGETTHQQPYCSHSHVNKNCTTNFIPGFCKTRRGPRVAASGGERWSARRAELCKKTRRTSFQKS